MAKVKQEIAEAAKEAAVAFAERHVAVEKWLVEENPGETPKEVPWAVVNHIQQGTPIPPEEERGLKIIPVELFLAIRNGFIATGDKIGQASQFGRSVDLLHARQENMQRSLARDINSPWTVQQVFDATHRIPKEAAALIEVIITGYLDIVTTAVTLGQMGVSTATMSKLSAIESRAALRLPFNMRNLGDYECFVAGTQVVLYEFEPGQTVVDASMASEPEQAKLNIWGITALAMAGAPLALGRRCRLRDEEKQRQALDALFHGEDLLNDSHDDLPDPLDEGLSRDDFRQGCDQVFAHQGEESCETSTVVLDRPVQKRKTARMIPAVTPTPPQEPTKSTRRGRLARAAWMGFFGIAGVFFLWSGFTPDAAPTTPLSVASSTAFEQSRYATKDIQDFHGFEWVLVRNPEVSDAQRSQFDEIDYRSWRWVEFRLTKSDGSLLHAGLGRPIEWVESNGIKPGEPFYLDLPELGAQGWADVLSIAPCPDPGPKPQSGCRLVTGTFRHSSADLIDLSVEGLDKRIGVTSNHRFWSEDRQAFVPAGQLREGERLRGIADETLTVRSILVRNDSEPVFNLEVEAEHVYNVSPQGLLVHNLYGWSRAYGDSYERVFGRTHGHHSYPKALGGHPKQRLADIAESMHTGRGGVHSDLATFEGGWLRPRQGMTAADIVDNFGSAAVEAGLGRFYSQDKWKYILPFFEDAVRYSHNALEP